MHAERGDVTVTMIRLGQDGYDGDVVSKLYVDDYDNSNAGHNGHNDEMMITMMMMMVMMVITIIIMI